MAGWIILGVILALLAAALLTPAAVRLTYDQGELAVRVGWGPVGRTLLPAPEKQANKKPSKPKKTDKHAKKRTKSAENIAEQKKKKLTREQLLYSLETLPPILGRALRRTGRRVRIQPLRLHLLVAGSDPADTAMLYGRLQAAQAALLPALHRLVRIREQDIQLFLDFQREELDCIAEIGVSIRLGDALAVALRSGGELLRWLVGFRRLAAPEHTTNTPPTPAEKEQ